MIRKCASNISRTACIYTLNQSNLLTKPHHPTSTPLNTKTYFKETTKAEMVFKPFFPFSSQPSFEAHGDSGSNYESKFGRVNGLNEGQRVYFVVITGMLFLLNVVARLSIQPKTTSIRANNKTDQ